VALAEEDCVVVDDDDVATVDAKAAVAGCERDDGIMRYFV
jgi:hypothetical protein